MAFPGLPAAIVASPGSAWADGCLMAIKGMKYYLELMRRKNGPLMTKMRTAKRMARAPA